MFFHMRAFTRNRVCLLVFCVTIVSLYSSKYIGHSLSLMSMVIVARLSIALLAGVAVTAIMATIVAFTGRSRSLQRHTLLTLRVAVATSVLMAAGSTGTSVPDWLISSF